MLSRGWDRYRTLATISPIGEICRADGESLALFGFGVRLFVGRAVFGLGAFGCHFEFSRCLKKGVLWLARYAAIKIFAELLRRSSSVETSSFLR